MAREFSPSIKDAKQIVSLAMPAAGAAGNTATIDLGHVPPGIPPTEARVLMTMPALPALVDTKTIIIKMQDSADNSSYADVDPLQQVTFTGTLTPGSLGRTVEFALPSYVRRYIQFTITVLAAAGDNTGVSAEFALVV